MKIFIDILLHVILIIVLFLVLTGGFKIDIDGNNFNIEKINIIVMAFVGLLLVRIFHFKKESLQTLAFVGYITKWLPRRDYDKLVAAFVACYAIFYSFTTSLKAYIFNLSCFDLGIFSQAVWNSAQGNFLFSSIKGDIVLLGDHFNPILILFAPLYWLWSSPTMLLILQSMVLASGAFPIYWMSKKKIGHPGISVVFVLAYLLYVPLRGVNLFQFHPIALVIPLYLYAFYYLIEGRYRFLIFLGFTFLCKENTSLINVMFGFYMVFFTQHKKLGMSIMLFSGLCFFLIIKTIIPAFQNPDSKNYLVSMIYPHLGKTVNEVFHTLLNQPVLVIKHLFETMPHYIWKIFRSIGFVSFLSPSTLLLCLPTLFINCLSAYAPMHTVKFQYTSGLIPFVFISAVYGVANLTQRYTILEKWIHMWSIEQRKKFIVWFIFLSTLTFFGKSDVRHLKYYIKESRSVRIQKIYRNPHFQNILNDKNLSVSVPTRFTAAFSMRKHVYQHALIGKADVHIFDKHPDTKNYRRLIENGYAVLEENPGLSLFIYKK